MSEYPEYTGEIKGLCPNKCSCDICRSARKKDIGYQEYLNNKWTYERKLENKRTLENAIAHDNLRGGNFNERAVKFFQG